MVLSFVSQTRLKSHMKWPEMKFWIGKHEAISTFVFTIGQWVVSLTWPNGRKTDSISLQLILLGRSLMKIWPWRGFCFFWFFGSIFLLFVTNSGIEGTFSIVSGDVNTMSAMYFECRPKQDFLKLILSISPYLPKCSRNSSENFKNYDTSLKFHSKKF